jgi:hypothetical protein
MASHDIDSCVARLVQIFNWIASMSATRVVAVYYHSSMNGTAYGVRIMVMCAENAHATTNPSVDADKHLRSIGGISRIVQYRG